MADLRQTHPHTSLIWDHTRLAARVLGAVHLTLLCVWWWREELFIDPHWIFADYTAPIWVLIDKMGAELRLGFWLVGALGLIIGRFTQISAALALFGYAITLSPLPETLIASSDALLIMLTSLFIVTRKTAQGAWVMRWGTWVIFTLWAWTSLSTLLEAEARIWRWGYAISYWGWTDVSPTPLALIVGGAPEWSRRAVGSVILIGLAWGPLIALSRVRFWPSVWCIAGPISLWVGGGLPTWIGTGVMVTLLIAFDERSPRGLNGRVQSVLQSLPSISSALLLGSQQWTVGLLSFVSVWMLGSYNSGVIPLLVFLMWILWRGQREQQNIEQLGQNVTRDRMNVRPWVTLTLWSLLISAPTFQSFWGERPLGSWGQRWISLASVGDWTHVNRQRDRLIIEMSDDGGSRWRDHTPKELTSVTLTDQPWRLLQPLRYQRWYHGLNSKLESEDGPLMEMIEQMLRHRIQALRAQGKQVDLKMVLARVRRERWVRAYQTFWRSEARGFFSVSTDLLTLLKARAQIKSSRKTRPKMPKLAND